MWQSVRGLIAGLIAALIVLAAIQNRVDGNTLALIVGLSVFVMTWYAQHIAFLDAESLE